MSGGTIAGSSGSAIATTGYTAGAVVILTLIDAVPEILNVSNVAGVQISNVGSEDVTSTLLSKSTNLSATTQLWLEPLLRMVRMCLRKLLSSWMLQ